MAFGPLNGPLCRSGSVLSHAVSHEYFLEPEKGEFGSQLAGK